MKISNEVKIGLIVVVAISLFIWGFNYLKGTNILKKDKTFYAIYNEIDGLKESGPVLINGFQVGQVEDIFFLPDNSGNLVVEISIQGNVNIPQNSVAKIFSFDLMGTKAINLQLSHAEIYCEEKDTLLAEVEEELAKQISKYIMPIKEKIEHLIVSTDSVLKFTRKIFDENTQKNIRSAIQNLENSTSEINSLLSKEGDLGKTFSNMEKFSHNLKENNKNLTKTITNISEITDSLNNSDIIKNIENTLASTNKIIEKINNGEGSLGLLINSDTLYDNLQAASKNLDRLLEDIRKNPKRYVHFSAIDMGKEVYVVDEKPEKIKKKDIEKNK